MREMRRNLKCLSWATVLTIMSFTASAQKPIENFASVFNQEQIILQHNKPYYLTADRVWYSVQLAGEAQKNKQSKVIYVSLIGADKTVLTSQRIIAEGGKAAGDFEIPTTAQSGYYELSASTLWSQSFGPSQSFNRRLLIINPSDANKGELPGDNIVVNLYPEGSNLVADVNAKVVVEVKAGNTLAPDAQVVLLDETGSMITTAETDVNGLAILNFVPKADQSYSAEIIVSNNARKRVALPAADASTLSLRLLKQSNTELYFGIENKTTKAYQFIVVQKGRVVYSQTVQNSGTIQVQKSMLSNGLAQVFALDMLGRAYNQQYIQVNKATPLQVKISTDKVVYAPREKVNTSIELRDGAGNPIQGQFNVSVFASQPNFQQPNDMLLTLPVDSQLIKSFVTGKRREIFEPELWPSPLTVENNNAASKQILNWLPVANINTANLPEPFSAFLLQGVKRRQIVTAYGISDTPAEAQVPRLTADKTYFMDDYVKVESVEHFLKHVVSNVRVKKQKDKYNLRVLYTDNTSKKYFFKETPLLLIDGVVVTEPEELLNIQVDDVNSIEVAWGEATLSGSNLGDKASNGLLAIYTKSGDVGAALKRKGADYLYRQYHLPSGFMLNTYDQAEAQIPDFRTQLFWSPGISSKDAAAGFGFYTSDELGEFKVLVQGITEDGEEFWGETTINVSLKSL